MMKKIEVTARAVKKFKDKFPSLLRSDLVFKDSYNENGGVVALYHKGKFVAYAYLCRQKKADGWILSLNENDDVLDPEFYRKKIKVAEVRRNEFYYSQETNAFRGFNAEGDGIGGLTIDYYAGYYVLTFYNRGIYNLRKIILDAFQEAITDYQGVYEKLPFNANHKGGVLTRHILGKESDSVVIEENGSQYQVKLNQGSSVGFLLEQRGLRQAIQEKYASEKIMLNGYSGNGELALAALQGGAFKVVLVNPNKKQLSESKTELKMNGFVPEKQELRAINVDSYLDYADKHHIAYPLVVLDPPAFKRLKNKRFDITKDYQGLIESAIKVTKPGGTLILTANTPQMTFRTLKNTVRDAFSESDRSFKLVEDFDLPADFVTLKQYSLGRYFKAVAIQVL